MYVTRPMSRYQDNPQAAAEPPPDGPGSGILVVEDEAAYATARMDGGGRAGTTHRTHTHTYLDDVVFVPVVGQPLSSGRYYAVRATGEGGVEGPHLGVHELRPRRRGARDGLAAPPPMPDLDSFDVGVGGSPPVVVGRWYCPFMFIKDGGEQRLKDQVKRWMFYEMTLEQSWKEIYSCDNIHRGSISSSVNNEVKVSVTVRRSTALLGGAGAVQGGAPQVFDGVMWFLPAASPAAAAGGGGGLGLDMVVWVKMEWELEKGGWVAGNGDDVERIKRVERRDGLDGQWDKFGCYLLVERFVLTRMDGSVALTYEFRHTDKITTKWDFDVGVGGSPPVVVGRWYCPFMFIKDGGEQRLKDQVKRWMFYKMTLEQSWKEIYSCDNIHRGSISSSVNNEVKVSVTVRRSTALLGGAGAVQGGAPQVFDGVMWFLPAASPAAAAGGGGGLGLDMVVWVKMEWELEKGGWVAGNGDDVERIKRVERRDGLDGQWDKFGCYLLVERFVLTRMDGSVALTYEFRHTDKITTKWE
uniref:Uncharacterized protein n=1 Tax=Oryza barthii TaxID=65489 RepID=A0A0D3H080_9ORYZ